MPLFTGAVAIFTAVSTFIATLPTAAVFALQMAAGIGLNLIAKAIKGTPEQEKVGIQGKLTAGGDVPRSVMLGWYNTAGSLVYRNTFGKIGDTPNAFYVEVRALADFPVNSLSEVWVDGVKMTLVQSANFPAGFGADWLTASEYIKTGTKFGDLQHLWFKFYDGTQTAADPTLVNWLGGSAYPYGSDRIGKGIAYVIIIALRDDLESETPLFNGFPQCKFTLQGAKLYDPSKDSTVGGSGSHRYSDPSTWGGDGDNLPAVQAYNILRGFRWNGKWLFGLQNPNPAILPAANWIAAINKCRTLVDGPNGQEAQYRSGVQADVNLAPADVIESLLKTCNGRITEVGGVYTIHVGEPETPTVSFTDLDILSSEEQVANPFRSIADSINGAQAKYPEPAEAWNVKTSPVTKNAAQAIRDGGRELIADADLSACPYSGQVQRLLKSSLLEALRERRHTVVMPPWAQILEPGDIVKWTSERNGYVDKWFRVDGLAYKANLDVMLQLTEVDPSDYSWNQSTDYIPPVFSPMIIARPAPQPVVDWYAEGQTVYDANGVGRRPVIYLSWDGNKRDISGIAYEIATTASDATIMHRGRTDDAQAGSIIVGSQAFIPGETYYARGRYIPTSPRDTPFSGWLPAILPNINTGFLDVDAAIQQQITEVLDQRFSDIWREITRVAVLSQQSISRTFLDKDEVRSEQVTLYDKNRSYIDSVKTTAADSDAALAQSITSLGVTVAGNKLLSEAAITETYQAFATADTALAQRIEEVSASVSDGTSELRGRVTQIEQVNVTQDGVISGIGSTVTSEVSRLDGRVDTTNANLTTTNNNLSTTNGNLSTVSATVSTQGTAIATLNGYAHAQWSVKTDVNGNIQGLVTLDSTSTKSTFTVVANTFYVCQPGVSGGTAVPMFAIDSVNGTNKLVFDGNMYADGGIFARSIAANQITATHLTANSVTAANGAIANFAVQSLKIADQAVIVPQLATGGVVYGPGGGTEATAVSTNISIDTTGLAGKTITLAIVFSGQQSTAGGNNWTVSIDVNGSNVSGYFGGTTFQPAFSATTSYSFTASGGTDVITVAGKYAAQTSMQINSSTLMVLGCKR